MYHNFITSRRGNIGDLKGQTDEMKATGEFYRYAGDARYNSRTAEEYTKAWQPFIDAYTDASVDELKGKSADYLSKKARAEYDTGYYSGSLGLDDAETKKSQNEATRAETEILTTLKKPLLEVFKNFEENEKNSKGDDKEFWTYAKAALAGFALNMYKGGSPNLNFDFGLLGLLGGKKGKAKTIKKLGRK